MLYIIKLHLIEWSVAIALVVIQCSLLWLASSPVPATKQQLQQQIRCNDSLHVSIAVKPLSCLLCEDDAVIINAEHDFRLALLGDSSNLGAGDRNLLISVDIYFFLFLAPFFVVVFVFVHFEHFFKKVACGETTICLERVLANGKRVALKRMMALFSSQESAKRHIDAIGAWTNVIVIICGGVCLFFFSQ